MFVHLLVSVCLFIKTTTFCRLKGDPVKQPTAVKKRKSPVSPTEPEEDDALDSRPVKKTKKSKTSITPTTTTTTSKTDAAKKDKSKAVKTVKKKDSAKSLDKKKDQKKAKTKSKKEPVPTAEPATLPTKKVTKKQQKQKQKQQSLPFEGLDRTKRRNMRKRLFKQRHQMLQEGAVAPIPTLPEPTAIVQEEQVPQSVAEEQDDTVKDLQIENLRIASNGVSEKLLKKNKNKKKNHLKGSKAENRSHVYYQESEQQQQQQQQSFVNNEQMAPRQNLYGRAFITSNESEPKYKGYRMPENHLPIHQMPTLFYANSPNHHDDEEPAKIASVVEADATPPSSSNNNTVMDTGAPVDYEKLPVADFSSNIPSIGDQLAIKTLELTANYTPEISDWKQVILKAMDLPNTITFVYAPGFGKTSTRGGKFDIKKHQKKRYDDYYGYEEEQEEEQENDMDLINEDEQEQDEVTMAVHDVYSVKNMSRK
ncbi:hypothetical protein FB192DRAFT_1104623 [Mucor lusitanicus]|uniref:Uncharacterized protein n=1 Tax=Mucor circinelloides f. lusitanicus TaxID=29924 RepID=A0A8H4BIZ1_MUCCL|nr:hypothetical protein FB192DRAFT_1104623 [Mucor lusitanicus]